MSVELSLKSVYVEITDRCNLYCKHCYNDSKYQNKKYLDIIVIKKIYQALHVKGVNKISISGGEPLLYPNIVDIMEYGRKYSIDTQLVTNGTILDKYIDYINNNPYVNLQVSIDGIGESHDLLRGNNTFKFVDSNLNKLSKDVYLSIKTSLNKYNIYEIEDIIQYAISKHAKIVAFSTLCIQGRSIENQDIYVTNKEIKATISELSELKEKYKEKIEVRPITINYSRCPFSLLNKADISPRIDPSGNVYLCSMFVNSMFALGNVYNNDLNEILDSQRCKDILNFLHYLGNIIECKGCLLDTVCQRGCLAQYLNNLPSYFEDNCSYKKSDILDSLMKNLNGVKM